MKKLLEETSFDELKKFLFDLGLPKESLDKLHKLYSKRFKDKPKNYPPPESIVKHLILNSFDSTCGNNAASFAAFLVCNEFSQKPTPWYWLEQDLAQDLCLTKIPEAIPNQINLPDQAIIVLPKSLGNMESPEISLFIGYKIFSSGKTINLEFNEVEVDNNCTFFENKNVRLMFGELPSSSYKLAWFSPNTIGVNGGIIGLNPQNEELQIYADDFKRLSRESSLPAQQILPLLINCLVYANPVNTDQQEIIVRKGFGKKGKSFSQPLWIGKGYKRTTPSQKTGKHKSPIVHYRRGHWRRSAIGENRAVRKWNWIKPTLVGVDRAVVEP